MNRKLNVIEFNVSAFRQNEKTQTSYSIPIEENLTTDDLSIKINDLCKSIRSRKNVVCVWSNPPFNFTFLSDNYIDEATVIINYTIWQDLSVSI